VPSTLSLLCPNCDPIGEGVSTLRDPKLEKILGEDGPGVDGPFAELNCRGDCSDCSGLKEELSALAGDKDLKLDVVLLVDKELELI